MSKHTSAFFASLASIVLSCAALAQPLSHASQAQVEAPLVTQTRALMASVHRSLDRQRAELDAGLRAVATWNEADRAKFRQSVNRSTVSADEKQIAALTAELRAMLQASQRGEIKGREAETRYVLRLRAVLGQYKAVSERQTAYFLREIRAIKGG